MDAMNPSPNNPWLQKFEWIKGYLHEGLALLYELTSMRDAAILHYEEALLRAHESSHTTRLVDTLVNVKRMGKMMKDIHDEWDPASPDAAADLLAFVKLNFNFHERDRRNIPTEDERDEPIGYGEFPSSSCVCFTSTGPTDPVGPSKKLRSNGEKQYMKRQA